MMGRFNHLSPIFRFHETILVRFYHFETSIRILGMLGERGVKLSPVPDDLFRVSLGGKKEVFHRILGALSKKTCPTSPYIIWVVVSNMAYCHPYLEKAPILTNIGQRGQNHQLVIMQQ